MAVTEVVVVASCPSTHHDEALAICRAHQNVAKAFGQQGDMVDMLSGDDWVAKWEAKVVSTAATLCDAFAVSRVTIICIHGGKHCDKELARQPLLKKAIKMELSHIEGFKLKVE